MRVFSHLTPDFMYRVVEFNSAIAIRVMFAIVVGADRAFVKYDRGPPRCCSFCRHAILR